MQDKKDKLEEILEKIKPYVVAHGGDIELAGIEGKTATLQIKDACPRAKRGPAPVAPSEASPCCGVGACISCPLADLTYNKIVRDAIKEKPEVEKKYF